MTFSGDLDFKTVRIILKDVEEKRKSLEDSTLGRLAKAIGRVSGAVSSAVVGVSKDIHERVVGLTTSGIDKLELTLSMDTSFMDACKEIVIKLEYLLDFYEGNPKVLSKDKFEPTKFQYAKREVIISFYGDSNAGKSTLLNCILGDRYLPSNQSSETAVTVHIQFLDPKQGEGQSSDQDEVLCCLNDKKTVLVKGQGNIQMELAKINKQTREAEDDRKSENSTYILKLKHPLGIVTEEDQKFLLSDNPGCDEYGSATVSSSIEMGKAVSSAFIFVTTIEGYTKLGSSGTLQSLYARNPDILKQHRLTIIINKMDSVLITKFDEKPTSQEEVISKIRTFFCSKVFNCDEDSLPPNSVVLVCGQWALIGRMYKTTQNESVKIFLMSQFFLLSLNSEFKNKEELMMIENDDHMEQAILLEKYSNIALLEERLKMMIAKSTLFWKQKMSQDLKDHLDNLSLQLKVLIQEEHKEIADLTRKIKLLFQAMEKLHSYLKECLENNKQCKKKKLPHTNKIWVQFKEAYEKDMKNELNLQTELKKDVDQKLNAFKTLTKDKIEKSFYTNTTLLTDLKQLFEDFSGSMNRYVSFLDNLAKAFQAANTNVQVEIAKLRNKFSSLFNSERFDEEDQCQNLHSTLAAFPKLTGIKSDISLIIPLQLSSWQQFLIFWKKIFRMPLDKYSEPTLKAYFCDEEVYFNESTMLDANEDDTLLLATSNDDNSSTSTGNESCCSESSGGGVSIIEIPYTKWTDDMENMKLKLRDMFYTDIDAFFENAEDNVIMKCCEQHYEAVLCIMKHFNETAADDINMCKFNLEEMMTEVEKKRKLYEVMNLHCEKADNMLYMFKHISENELSNCN